MIARTLRGVHRRPPWGGLLFGAMPLICEREHDFDPELQGGALVVGLLFAAVAALLLLAAVL